MKKDIPFIAALVIIFILGLFVRRCETDMRSAAGFEIEQLRKESDMLKERLDFATTTALMRAYRHGWLDGVHRQMEEDMTSKTEVREFWSLDSTRYHYYLRDSLNINN